MMYQIAYNGEFIYGSDENKTVLNPTLEVELNSAGTLTLTIPVENEAWNNFEVFRGEVEVYEGDDIIWFGRPLQIVRDWKNQKVVTCEGALAYFNDSLQVTKEYKQAQTPLYTDTTVYPGKTGFINDIIGLHNDQVESNRKIYIGEIDIDNELVYRYVDYETTADILQQMCLDTNGGYFIIRKGPGTGENEGQIVNYLDWCKEMPYSTDQPIQFGLNLLDLNQDLNGADICTVLLPTGENDLNISTVQVYSEDDPNHPPYHINDPEGDILHGSNSVYMTHMQGYKRFGRVVKTKDFNNIADKNSLFQKAAEWLNDQNVDVTTIECSAADLHYLNEYSDYGKLRIGQLVQVGSTPHDLSKELPIYKISMKLDSGAKTITMGTPPKRELTDIVKNNGGSTRGSSGATGTGSADGSGSSGGSTYVPVKDVQVKMPGSNVFGTVVQKRVAKIDLSELGSGDVTDVKVNGTSVVDEDGVANVTVPSVPVQDVYLDGDSVLDENGIARITSPTIPVTDVQVDNDSILDGTVAKLNSSDFGTYVEGNPSGQATDDLNTIQIGDDIFNVVGSGGGGTGGHYTCDLLFVNDPLPSPTSGTSDVERTYTLLHNVYAYDAVYIVAYTVYIGNTANNVYTGICMKQDYGTRIWLNGSIPSYQRTISCEITDDTHIMTHTSTRQSNVEPILYKVYGLKFNANIFSPTIYSEEEREVGVWIDGKPLYQKTFNFGALPNHTYKDVSTGLTNVKIIKSEGYSRSSSGTVELPYVSITSAGTSIGYTVLADNTIRVSTGSDRTAFTETYITLWYTKTTDTSGSAYWLPGGVMAVNYSTDEQIIGLWNGQTLYQKMWDLGSNFSFANDAWTEVTGLTNVPPIQNLVKAFGQQDYVNVDSVAISFDAWYDSSKIKIKSLREETEKVRYIILQYTKTTDTPGSASPTILATQAELEAMADHFQDGVDSVYDACVAKGSTPASHALSDVVDAIGSISGGGQLDNPIFADDLNNQVASIRGKSSSTTVDSIAANTGKYFLVITIWKNASSFSGISSISNGTYTLLASFNYSNNYLNRLYLVTKNDETASSSIRYTDVDSSCVISIKENLDYTAWVVSGTSGGSLLTIPQNNNDYILFGVEKTSNNSTNNMTNIVGATAQRVMVVTYSGYNRGEVYLLHNKKDSDIVITFSQNDICYAYALLNN